MKTSRHNRSLWWSDLLGKLKILLGVGCFFMGLGTGLIWLFTNSLNYGFISIALISIAIYSTIKGSQQRFDFQRRSGYIVYNGY